MRDEQVERLLAEVKQAFGESEMHRKIEALSRFLGRVIPHVQDREEGEALIMVLHLARDGFHARIDTQRAVLVMLGEFIGADGVCYPPPDPEIARRLSVSPAAVDAALQALVAAGFLEELRPKGFIRRQRRFRFVPPGET
jgi:hypothetical protein